MNMIMGSLALKEEQELHTDELNYELSLKVYKSKAEKSKHDKVSTEKAITFIGGDIKITI